MKQGQTSTGARPHLPTPKRPWRARISALQRFRAVMHESNDASYLRHAAFPTTPHCLAQC